MAEGAAQYMETVLQPILVQGLTVLAKEKPCAHPVEALSFLGQWLLDNNPNKVCGMCRRKLAFNCAYCAACPVENRAPSNRGTLVLSP